MPKPKPESKPELIEVYTDGEPIRFVHEVAPVPILEIVKGARYQVYRRSGVIQRMLKSGQLLEVKPSPPPKAKEQSSGPSAPKAASKPADKPKGDPKGK
jgi:hypothetical protein